MKRKSIYSLSYKDLCEFLKQNNISNFIANQIFTWLYKKDVSSFEQMTDISKKNITLLNENFYFDTLKEVKKEIDPEDETTKFLFELHDGNKIESVIMKFNHGYSACVSSQIGCNMGCIFCASGKLKKLRNLEVNELVLQILHLKKYLLEKKNVKLSSFVIMGIGEPFDNFDNIVKFIDIAKEQRGIEIGARHITVSTSGVANKIREWADLESQVNLAISLHAPNDELRSKLMPINKAFPLKELFDSLEYYFSKNNRRITFEYLLIDGINDSIENANELTNILSKFRKELYYVNLIPYNPITESEFKRSKNVKKFLEVLNKRNITCTIRQERGKNISAACGQLRSKYK